MFKNSFCQVSLGFLSLLAAGLVAGCLPPVAVAPRNAIVVQPLKSFTSQSYKDSSLLLVNPKFFLWPDPVTPDQITTVIDIGNEMDRRDAEMDQVYKGIDDLGKKIKALQDTIDGKVSDLNNQQNPIKGSKYNLKKASDKLAAAQKSLEEEKAKTPPDSAAIKKLEDSIQTLTGQCSKFEKAIADLTAATQPLEAEIEKLKEDPDLLQYQGYQAKKDDYIAFKQESGATLSKIVTWYSFEGGKVDFQFQKDGTIDVSVDGWTVDQDEGVRRFSTKAENGKKPTIENVKYTEVGGFFDFDVRVYQDDAQTQLRETFSIHLARTRYDSGDGKGYYEGTLLRTAENKETHKTEIRRGSAKLVDIGS